MGNQNNSLIMGCLQSNEDNPNGATGSVNKYKVKQKIVSNKGLGAEQGVKELKQNYVISKNS